jgi:ABC-type Na+ transport system ATPase subunit NatA
VIEVEGLTKDYGTVVAVREVTFSVGRGEVVGFLGPNGAGKSTTLRILAGFLGATSGRVRVNGFDIAQDSLRARGSLGYMPEAAPLYPELRVREYLQFRARLKRVARGKREQSVQRSMERARLLDVSETTIGHLSKGYRQRVGLADALVFNIILNDWTSAYTERTLLSVSNLYLDQKKYNEAIAPLKKLELTAEYKSHYNFAINNLMVAYFNIHDFDNTLMYARYVKEYEKSSVEDKAKADLYAAKAHMLKGDLSTARKELNQAVANSQTIVGAEAKYNIGKLQYEAGEYKAAQETAFDLIKNMPSYDYWVAKSFILLADCYTKLKDEFQAKSTLQSIIENYEGKDDIIPTAKERLEKLTGKKIDTKKITDSVKTESDSTAVDSTETDSTTLDSSAVEKQAL